MSVARAWPESKGLHGQEIKRAGYPLSLVNTEEIIYQAIECATRVYGDLSRAREWLHTPYPAFGGLTPLDLALKGGLSTVARELDSLAEGSGVSVPEVVQSKTEPAIASNQDTLDPSAAVRQRLAEMDPDAGGPSRKVVASIAVSPSVDQILSDLSHLHGISRISVVGAAGVWWIRGFERCLGQPIPLDPLQIQNLPPGLTRRIVDGLWRGDTSRILNSRIPEELDRKLSKAVYLIERSGWRVSKRRILGSSVVLLSQELVQLSSRLMPNNEEASAS